MNHSGMKQYRLLIHCSSRYHISTILCASVSGPLWNTLQTHCVASIGNAVALVIILLWFLQGNTLVLEYISIPVVFLYWGAQSHIALSPPINPQQVHNPNPHPLHRDQGTLIIYSPAVGSQEKGLGHVNRRQQKAACEMHSRNSTGIVLNRTGQSGADSYCSETGARYINIYRMHSQWKCLAKLHTFWVQNNVSV